MTEDVLARKCGKKLLNALVNQCMFFGPQLGSADCEDGHQ